MINERSIQLDQIVPCHYVAIANAYQKTVRRRGRVGNLLIMFGGRRVFARHWPLPYTASKALWACKLGQDFVQDTLSAESRVVSTRAATSSASDLANRFHREKLRSRTRQVAPDHLINDPLYEIEGLRQRFDEDFAEVDFALRVVALQGEGAAGQDVAFPASLAN